MRKLIVANWKLHPKTLPEAKTLTRGIALAAVHSPAQVVICPPAPYLGPLKSAFPKIVFGAQDVFSQDEGPYTGAVGPSALKSVGARYVIAGHSERRTTFGETDKDVSRKAAAALAEGLTLILCIGEPLAVRKEGIAVSQRFVADQAKQSLQGILSRKGKVVLAYEPVWAISTSGSHKHETPEDAAAMIRFIKKAWRLPVIYGGSVDAKSASEFLAYRDIDGLLVGHASLDPKEFNSILKNA